MIFAIAYGAAAEFLVVVAVIIVVTTLDAKFTERHRNDQDWHFPWNRRNRHN